MYKSTNDRVTTKRYTPLTLNLNARILTTMNTIRSNVPAVWVLIFDRKPTNCEFDRLDLESTCFEQFLLQDVRSNAAPHEVFGGERAFSELANVMAVLGQNASFITVSTDATNTSVMTHDDHLGMESSMRRSQMPLLSDSDPNLNDSCGAEITSLKSASLRKTFSANLVWIEAGTSTSAQPAIAATTILNSVYDQLAACSSTEQKCPILIVTFRRGNNLAVCEPLKCGISENSMNVPLWIRPSLGHTCRVQTLTGSFDLLPTIATFLRSAEATDEVSPPDVPQISDVSDREVASAPLSSEPQSLAFLCGAPQVCSNRVLRLQGDTWTAARTEGFMLVVPDATEPASSKTESDGDSSEEPSRRLYVKPDDRFNVNDVSRTYATVVEDLSGVLQDLDKQAC